MSEVTATVRGEYSNTFECSAARKADETLDGMQGMITALRTGVANRELEVGDVGSII
jgi:hypothetical protein